MKSARSLVALCVGILSAALVACGGGGGSDGGPTPPAGTAPGITAQPQNASVPDGQAAGFAVTATGDAPLAFQWRRNGADIAGATGSQYDIAAVTLADDGATFSVAVSNGSGQAVSGIATLSVTPVAPTIQAQPASVGVTAGQGATFSVAAVGSAPLGYQWRRDGVDIAGATGPSHTTAPTVIGDDGAVFSVRVSNTAGAVSSNGATLTVSATVVAPAITTQPAPVTVTEGQTATFSVTASGSAPLAYQWRRNGVPVAGATAFSHTTAATTLADRGASFSVVVSNGAGDATSDPATLTVNAVGPPPTLPVIVTQPANTNVLVGQSVTFSVVATGTALGYQWQRNGLPIAGATGASYTTPPAITADNGAVLTVVVSSGGGSVTSVAATLAVRSGSAPTITGQPLAFMSLNVGGAGEFGVTATGVGPTYQWRRNGADIAGATATSYRTPPVSAGDHGATWSVLVCNTSGCVTSVNATLRVVDATTPPVVRFAAGNQVSLALRQDGSVWGWGVVSGGALSQARPLTYFYNQGAPVQAVGAGDVPLGGVADVRTASGHTLMRRTDGTLWGTGNNGKGELGDGTTTLRLSVVPVSNAAGGTFGDVVTIGAGLQNSYAITSDGKAWAWGNNFYQQLGDGTATNRSVPTPVLDAQGAHFGNVKAVAGAGIHTLWLKTDGTVWAVGVNNNSQLGDGTQTDRANPVRVETAAGVALDDVVAIAAGPNHSLALRGDGTAWSWGNNTWGALGRPSDFSGRPRQVVDAAGNPITGIVAIAAGGTGTGNHSFFVLASGGVLATGSNIDGRLGDGTTSSRANPVPVMDAGGGAFGGVVALSTHSLHTLAQKSDGTLWSWGSNNARQLGDGTETDRTRPVQVQGLTP